MEQSWPVEKFDPPRGDLEFWAQKRGALPEAANENNKPEEPKPPSSGAATALRRIALIAWLSIVLGFAMQALVLVGKLSVGNNPGLTQVMIDLAQGVTWSFFVCAGVGLGTTIAKAHKALGGLIGLIVAPIAMGIAKGSQKFMVSALGATQKPVLLSLTTLGVIRAIEYGILGWVLAWLVANQESRATRFLLAGAAVGLVFGGSTTMLTFQAAAAKGIALAAPQIVATAVNEVVFPMGCALVVFIALHVGRQLKLVAVSDGKPG